MAGFRKHCPVCGQKGTSKGFYSESATVAGMLSYETEVMVCKYRGRGCGEVWKARPRNGCKEVMNRLANAEKHIHRVNLGYRMVQMMKDIGIHEPYTRKIKAREVYGPYKESIALDYNSSGLCACGCGKPMDVPDYPSAKPPFFATWSCKNSMYEVAQMIATQDSQLRQFLVSLRGQSCESCKTPALSVCSLQVDHIVEVVNGGGLCWIDNFQLLCDTCHKAKTAKLAKDRADQRKAEKVSKTGQQSLF